MISVPNRQPLSNGSKWLGFLLLSILLSSCAFFTKVEDSGARPSDEEDLASIQGRRVYDPQTGQYVTVEAMPTELIDTIQWKIVSETIRPPITSDGNLGTTGTPGLPTTNEYGSEFLSAYNVSIMLPFLTSRFDPVNGSISEYSYWSLNFYAGVRLALEDLQNENTHLNVTVLDSDASDAVVGRMLQTREELRNAHLIIGPYRRDNIRMVADYAKLNDIVMVSPYSASDNLTEKNPNFIQASPTLETHCVNQLQNALSSYSPEQIVLVCRDDPAEKARLKYFQEAYFRLMGSRNATKLQEYIVATNTADYQSLDVMPFIQLSDTTVFIVPSWDETFVYSFLRKVAVTKTEMNEIVVYGMPQWMEFEYVDFDTYEKLNLHVSSNFYVDPLAPNIQFFKRRYYNSFGKVPTLEAIVGYDIMLYFGRMLKKHGTKFQYALEKESAQYLHTRFDFERVVLPTTTGVEKPPVERFENKYLNILKFQDYQFQPAN